MKGRKVPWLGLACGVLLVLTLVYGRPAARYVEEAYLTDPAYREVETRLRPLATALPAPRPGDWLDRHPEEGQTFGQYLKADPVRRGPERKTLYVCQIGDFSPERQQVFDLTREYLGLFYDVPVVVLPPVPLADIPASAQRKHPSWGDHQLLATYVMNQVLEPKRPADALAYLAFTSHDLYPGEGWNFVFGMGMLRERVGVWSVYRHGDPAQGPEAFRLALRRAMGVASHETGHILTMAHCTAFACNMNGSNNLEESDRQPLHFCPVCLRKLCWNLQVEPVPYLRRLEAFCTRNGLTDEAAWYAQAATALAVP
jgi:archaemetzincin